KIDATASAVAALARLTRPGSWSVTTWRDPSGATTASPSSVHCGLGRRSSQLVQYQSASGAPPADMSASPDRTIAPPHSGHTHESSCQRWPAATQVTSGTTELAQTTIGS